MAKITYKYSGRKLSAQSERVLSECADSVQLGEVVVTSTQRTPQAQAEEMYVNVANGNIIGYKPAGAAVQSRCADGIKAKEHKSVTLAAMVAMIERYSDKGQRVSKHCVSDAVYDRCNIADLSITRIADTRKAVLFAQALKARREVCKVIQPLTPTVEIYDKSEPAIHVEILQS